MKRVESSRFVPVQRVEKVEKPNEVAFNPQSHSTPEQSMEYMGTPDSGRALRTPRAVAESGETGCFGLRVQLTVQLGTLWGHPYEVICGYFSDRSAKVGPWMHRFLGPVDLRRCYPDAALLPLKSGCSDGSAAVQRRIN